MDESLPKLFRWCFKYHFLHLWKNNSTVHGNDRPAPQKNELVERMILGHEWQVYTTIPCAILGRWWNSRTASCCGERTSSLLFFSLHVSRSSCYRFEINRQMLILLLLVCVMLQNQSVSFYYMDFKNLMCIHRIFKVEFHE